MFSRPSSLTTRRCRSNPIAPDVTISFPFLSPEQFLSFFLWLLKEREKPQRQGEDSPCHPIGNRGTGDKKEAEVGLAVLQLVPLIAALKAPAADLKLQAVAQVCNTSRGLKHIKEITGYALHTTLGGHRKMKA
eukprot:1160353-Pelagomonas_calceolata.AAC.16